MNKRGQFYLIAAFVIIGLIVGITTVYNKIVIKEEDPVVYDLSDEINFEAGAVIDSGIFNELNTGEISAYLIQLLDFYASTNPGSDIVVLFGDATNMTLLVYNTTSTGQINLDYGGASGAYTITASNFAEYNFDPEGNTVTVVLGDGVKYEFEIKPGQSFFLILKKTSEDEIFVSAPETSSTETTPGFSPSSDATTAEGDCGHENQRCCLSQLADSVCVEGLDCQDNICKG